MLKGQVKNFEEKFLRRFSRGRDMPDLKNQQEKKIFEELQRHDLIRVGPAGKIRITRLGEYALGVGVRRYIANARLERKLLMEYVKGKSQGRWLMLAGLLLTLLILSIVALNARDMVGIF